jgi:DUF1016 N-terminal domain/Protein of unknown function (DUF1156)
MNNHTQRFGERRGLFPPSGPPGQARRLARACRRVHYKKPLFSHLVLDADTDCPVVLGPGLLARAAQVCAALPVKSIRHEHPSTLHLWWARRPLAVCRAVLFSLLVDDPDSDPAYRKTDGTVDEERAATKRAAAWLWVRTVQSWGKGVVEQPAAHIAQSHPGLRGYTRSNLLRMRQFHDTYRGNAIVAPLVRQLPWTHNLLILSRSKRAEERELYLRMANSEKWSKREL